MISATYVPIRCIAMVAITIAFGIRLNASGLRSTISIQIPPIELPEVVLRQPAPYTPPPPPSIEFESPMYFACDCGAIRSWGHIDMGSHASGSLPAIIAEDLRTPEPGPALLTAFRDARYVELWRLKPIADPTPVIPYRNTLIYRDRLIAAFVRQNNIAYSGNILAILLPTLTSAELEWNFQDLRSPPDPIPLEGMIRHLHFTPDLVVTFAGSQPIRLEFEFSSGIALVQTTNKWGFFTISAPDMTALQTLSESLTLPNNPRLVPQLALVATGN